MKFFDSIVHATEDGLWLGGSQHDASESRLLEEMNVADVDCACLVGLSGYIDNSFVSKLAEQHPGRFFPIASLNPSLVMGTDQVAAAVGKLSHQGFAGIKLHPRLNSYDPLDERCVAGIAAAGERRLVVFLDTLFRRRGRATLNAPDVVDYLANACPNTRLILLHGGGSAILETAEAACIHENVWLDVSHTLLRYRGSSLDADLRWIFANRDRKTVLGSDFPEHTPEESRTRALELMDGLAEVKKQNILYRNLELLFEPFKLVNRQGTPI